MQDKKQEILKWLKEFNRLSTSRFTGLLGLNYDSVKILLNELVEEGKVIEEKETNASYWVLGENND